MFNELKAFSNVKKRTFLENFKNRIQTYNEDEQLRELNNLFKFDKDNSPFLTHETIIFDAFLPFKTSVLVPLSLLSSDTFVSGFKYSYE